MRCGNDCAEACWVVRGVSGGGLDTGVPEGLSDGEDVFACRVGGGGESVAQSV